MFLSFVNVRPCHHIILSCVAFTCINEVDAWTHEVQRRTVLTTAPSSLIANAFVPPTNNLPLEGSGGSVTRVEGIGGGFDLMQTQLEKGVDVIYPASIAGTWKCNRVVVAIEGDAGQAELAWRNLGGINIDNKPVKGLMESYIQTFTIPPSNWNIKNEYMFEGETYKGAILDRGLDISSRRSRGGDAAYNVSWDIDTQTLKYENNNKSSLAQQVQISTLQRKVEYPSVNGFGFDELYKITSSAGGLFLGDNNNIQRAVRVKRRYRRALDDNGNRIVDGLEIMKVRFCTCFLAILVCIFTMLICQVNHF